MIGKIRTKLRCSSMNITPPPSAPFPLPNLSAPTRNSTAIKRHMPDSTNLKFH